MKRTNETRMGMWLAVTAGIGAVYGCAPVFSDLQGARVLAPGRVEVTPSYSAVLLSADGDTRHVQDDLGVQVATGVSPGFELRGRIEHVEAGGLFDDGPSINWFSAGAKIALAGDRLAAYLPIAFAVNEDFDDLGEVIAAPTLLATVPLRENQTELNFSGKALIPLSNDGNVLAAANVGLALGSDLSCWALRPEAGILFHPGDDGFYAHISLGLSFAVR
jgi:hypothetical protein